MTWLRAFAHRLVQADPDDLVPVRTRLWCTVVMSVCATLTALGQTACIASYQMERKAEIPIFWSVISFIISTCLPTLIIIRRDRQPYAACLVAGLASALLAFDSLTSLMTMTSMVARRKRLDRLTLCCSWSALATVIAFWRDLSMPGRTSFIMIFFTVKGSPSPNHLPIGLALWTVMFALALAVGIYIHMHTATEQASAQASAARERSSQLEASLGDQRVADAIAVETHDTLAHSLSLIALNASALKVEADKLAQAQSPAGPDDWHRKALEAISQRADDIRQQAAGALDETHSVIDMLRHPDQVIQEIQPDPQTSLTRQSLDDICRESRDTGMSLNTWIDVQNLSDLDPTVSKVAYRTIQEGLTNARRHAPGMPVSLEVTALPDQGVHVHLTNPMPRTAPAQGQEHAGGNGLKGLTARVAACSGQCAFGLDGHGQFNLDVVLPFRKIATNQE